VKAQASEWHWLDAHETIPAKDLCRSCRISAAELGELVEYGALQPIAGSQEHLAFSAEWVAPLREAARLRRTFDLDLFTVVLVLDYLNRIATLERELKSLRAQLPAHAPVPSHPPHEGPAPWREPHGRGARC
jgi:chaperone modulatory protein CbpM